MELRTSAGPRSSMEVDILPEIPSERSERSPTASQRTRPVNVRSRFDALLQQLKEAHDQEIAELRPHARHRLVPHEKDDAGTKRAIGSLSSSTSTNRSSKASCASRLSTGTPARRSGMHVGFTWHGKAYGTASRKVSRVSGVSSHALAHRASHDVSTGLVPALKQPQHFTDVQSIRSPCQSPSEDEGSVALSPPSVSQEQYDLAPEGGVHCNNLSHARGEVTCVPLASPTASYALASPTASFVPSGCTSSKNLRAHFSTDGDDFAMVLPEVAPPGLVSEAKSPSNTPMHVAPSSGTASWGINAERHALEMPQQDGEGETLVEIQKPVLECDLEKLALPEELKRDSRVKAALANDQVCLVDLHFKRNHKRYKLEHVWAGITTGTEPGVIRQSSKSVFGKSGKRFQEPADVQSSPSAANILSGGALSRRFAVRPNSIRRLCWDYLTTTLLAYDVLAMPVLLGFSPRQNTFLLAMELVIATVWSADILASFLTGYYGKQNTQLVLDLGSIAVHYLKTWFVLDIILVVYDWILITMEDQGNTSSDSGDNRGAQLGRSLRTLRFIRIVRLLRLLKVNRIMQEIHDRLPSEAASIVFRVFKIIACLIIANHIVACAWYFIGNSQGRGVASWVEENAMESQTLAYQYFVSLHWSLSQFTPAGMEISPAFGSLAERAFSVVVILVAMVGFSSFVSILTASMAELRKIASHETYQFWMLRRFLRDWSVSDELSRRINRYLEYAYGHNRRRVQFSEVHLMKLLSRPMRNELLHEMLAVHIRIHPLFDLCGHKIKIFAGALSTMSVARGDSVFTAGQHGVEMYFVVKGRLLYILGEFDADYPDLARWSDEERDIIETMTAGTFASEATLWTPWLHLGDLEGIDDCTLVTIKADEFQKSVGENMPLLVALRHYAAAFVRELNCVGITDLTDLLYQIIYPSEIIAEVGFKEDTTDTTGEETDDPAVSVQHPWGFKSGLLRSFVRQATGTSSRSPALQHQQSVAVLNMS